MRELYGDAGAEQVERDYKMFIDGQPELAKWLVGELRSHPVMMEMLVRVMRAALAP